MENTGLVRLSEELLREMATGHAVIDADHARIFQKLSDVEGADLVSRRILVEELKSYVLEHVQGENWLMKESRYPPAKYHAHFIEHDQLQSFVIEKMSTLLREVQQRGDEDTDMSLTEEIMKQTVQEVRQRFFDHFNTWDKEMAQICTQQKG